MVLLTELKANKNIVLMLKGGIYKSSIMEINKQLSDTMKKIVYIAISNPSDALIAAFKKEGIDTDKYYFIDCISKKGGGINLRDNCKYMAGPTAMTKISICVSKLLEKKKTELIFLDSISSMLIYNDELSVIKFLHNIMNKVRLSDAKAVYIILESDLEKKLMKDVELFADKIVEFEY
jgi:hypothetical protein